MATIYNATLVDKLNQQIRTHFPNIYPIESGYKNTFSGVSRLVMLDRYSQKDRDLVSLDIGDLIVCVVRDDPKFPSRGVGYVIEIDRLQEIVTIKLEDEFMYQVSEFEANDSGTIRRRFSEVDKPVELYYEQIAKRVGHSLAEGELTPELRHTYGELFAHEIGDINLVPAGRVLFGAGSGTAVTYFNCYVMPFVRDSRGGIADHRKEIMEIMSRGGGVGTNGSTLRPRGASAKGVGGRSSGAVSWLNDIANLTNLVEQGGSRRGAQMIMLSDWHPDIIEFIVSKMQNPMILRWLAENSKDEEIRREANAKLKFVPLSLEMKNFYEEIVRRESLLPSSVVERARKQLLEGGEYRVINSEFLSGANISVTLTKDFMDAVEHDQLFPLRFPDLDAHTKEQKKNYDEHWHEIGDVREWERLGYPVKTYRTIRAKDLWDLISVCATYSAEPGIFFIDTANDMTNAVSYGQRVVATNPCGEQPLAPYSVCNLSAINLANFVDRSSGEILFEKLATTVRLSVRMQDNVIDNTPYFLEANRIQATGERRVGLGVMGLHDLLIWAGKRYGSREGNLLVDRIFETIATAAYRASIDLAKEKGSFPFLSDREKFINTGYMKKMPEDIRQDILRYGIRNSHLLTIAPTGSTGTMVGVSTGLEPHFSFSYYRSGRLGKFIEVNASIVDEWLELHPGYTKQTLPDFFISAMQLTPEEHADTQCVIQRWVDSSISKTVNAPQGFSVEQVQQIYERLYKGGAKGGTVYVDGSRDAQVLTLTNAESQVSVQLNIEKELLVETSLEANVKDGNGREIGVEVGNICPICNEGIVEEIGGCNSCTVCKSQLKCGL